LLLPITLLPSPCHPPAQLACSLAAGSLWLLKGADFEDGTCDRERDNDSTAGRSCEQLKLHTVYAQFRTWPVTPASMAAADEGAAIGGLEMSCEEGAAGVTDVARVDHALTNVNKHTAQTATTSHKRAADDGGHHGDADDATISIPTAIFTAPAIAAGAGGGAAASGDVGCEAGSAAVAIGVPRDAPPSAAAAPPPAKRRRGKEPISDAAAVVTSTRVAHGLRWVEPYHHTFETHAKGRWVGREILEVFAKEFQSEPREAYEEAIGAGACMSGISSKRCLPSLHLTHSLASFAHIS
jgi:hypothetical protein